MATTTTTAALRNGDGIGDYLAMATTHTCSLVNQSLQVTRQAWHTVVEQVTRVASPLYAQCVQEVQPVVLQVYQEWKGGLQHEWNVYTQQRGNSTAKFLATVLVLFVVAFHMELLQLFQEITRRGGLLEQWRLALMLHWQRIQRHRRRSLRKLQQQKRLSTVSQQQQQQQQQQHKLASPTSTASTVEAEASLHSSRPLSPLPPPPSSNSRFRKQTLPSSLSPKTSKSGRVGREPHNKHVQINDHSSSNNSQQQQQQQQQFNSSLRSTSHTAMHASFYNDSITTTTNSCTRSRSRSPFRSASMGHGGNGNGGGPSARLAQYSPHGGGGGGRMSPMRVSSLEHAPKLRLSPYGHVQPPSLRLRQSALRKPSIGNTSYRSSSSNNSRRSNNSVSFQHDPHQQPQPSHLLLQQGSSRSTLTHDSMQSFDILATSKNNHFQNNNNNNNNKGDRGSPTLLDSIQQQQQQQGSNSTLASKETKDTSQPSHSNSVLSSTSCGTPSPPPLPIADHLGASTTTTTSTSKQGHEDSSNGVLEEMQQQELAPAPGAMEISPKIHDHFSFQKYMAQPERAPSPPPFMDLKTSVPSFTSESLTNPQQQKSSSSSSRSGSRSGSRTRTNNNNTSRSRKTTPTMTASSPLAHARQRMTSNSHLHSSASPQPYSSTDERLLSRIGATTPTTTLTASTSKRSTRSSRQRGGGGGGGSTRGHSPDPVKMPNTSYKQQQKQQQQQQQQLQEQFVLSRQDLGYE